MSDNPDKRQELIERARQHKQELEEEQERILESIQDEHGGDVIETDVEITKDHTATVRTKVNGDLINRMSYVEEQLSDMEDGEMFTGIENTMDQAAAILGDVVVDSEFDKSLFYAVYESDGPDALGTIALRVFEAIGEGLDRKNRHSED